jgi:hypothetical protein
MVSNLSSSRLKVKAILIDIRSKVNPLCFRREPDRQCESAPDAWAAVHVPVAAPEDVQESRHSLTEAEGVRLAGVESGAVVVQVGSGRYSFLAAGRR